uniref:subtilisin n=1 Tax=Alexandrium catenella TaxID=2925 RepID=A0A7S1LMN5_ALECA
MYKYADSPVPSQAIQMPAEFQDDSAFSPADLKAFFSAVALPDQTDTHRVGPFNDQVPDVEATLDTQYIASVGLGVDNWYWTSAGWMYTFANNLYNYEQAPNVVSISWGWAESQQCTVATVCDTIGANSRQYVQRVNTEFMKLGAMGISLFVASGDSGANGRSDPACTGPRLNPVFPAASPYVTSVGATMLQDPETSLQTPPPVCSKGPYAGTCASAGVEVAVSAQKAGFTSGGGFSDYAARPSYQDAAVKAYLQSGVALPPAARYNASGRGFPDVAAMGNNFLIYIQSEGGWQPVGGTSASTPTWAGIAGRLVDLALKKTGKPLGFMNPLLYQMHAELPGAFVDVTVGDNKCTESGCSAACKGFECAKGWDPVTGLGTPQYDVMAAYVTGLIDKSRAVGQTASAASDYVV